jgi:hypothetical protein
MRKGNEVSDEDPADMMIHLQNRLSQICLSHTHVMPNILSATRIAEEGAMASPMYNTSGTNGSRY